MTTLNQDINERRSLEVSPTLEVGSIAVSTWGYDQTNVDFYLVLDRRTRKDGSVWVQVQRIHAVQTPTSEFMQYQAVPFRSAVKQQVQVDDRHRPVWRKLHGEGFEPNSYSWARPWDGEPVWGSSYA